MCASCPADGSAPRGPAAKGIISEAEPGPNMTSLADDGTLAFATPTALAPGDQNTASAGQEPKVGEDVYEWRDGRALLASDGLTETPQGPGSVGPRVAAIGPTGRDLFFTESAQLTPDALDGYRRLYDARIGGGIDFPPAGLPPCDLNSGGCEGPAGAPPSLPGAGSAAFAGPGNPRPSPCAAPARRAKRLSRAARRQRRAAKRLSDPRRGRAGRRKARRLAAKAHKLSRRARRCRRRRSR